MGEALDHFLADTPEAARLAAEAITKSRAQTFNEELSVGGGCQQLLEYCQIGDRVIDQARRRMTSKRGGDVERRDVESALTAGMRRRSDRDQLGEVGVQSSRNAHLMRILEEKGHVGHQHDGPRYVYVPTVPADSARTLYGLRIKRLLAKSPELFGKVVPVYFLDTDLSENSDWDRRLTDEGVRRLSPELIAGSSLCTPLPVRALMMP